MTEPFGIGDLAGRCVVVTRPAQQAASLLDALRVAGAEPLFFPVIEIVPLADAAPLRALAAILADYDVAFFVSANAVEQTLAVLPPALWPASLRVVTVGPGSARALRAHGFEDVMLPSSSFDSEGVLAMAEMQPAAIAGKRVLILRGDGGRELLATGLRERGARVDVQGCYQRRPVAADPTDLLARFATKRLDALSFTSSEGARNFANVLDSASGAGGARAMLAALPCFVPHPRIEEYLRSLGAQQLVLTGAGDAALILALRQYFGTTSDSFG
ncbi:MAG: uroporphyrinogen synthase [Rhodocyclales bacterium]|nr:uroporphyrinogen synthase [Rhodocyclales bacterium]